MESVSCPRLWCPLYWPLCYLCKDRRRAWRRVSLLPSLLRQPGAGSHSVGTGAILLLIAALLFQQPLVGYAPSQWLALLALGLVSQVGGWLSINYSLGHIPATRVSVTLLAQAVVTTFIAVPLLGEIPTPAQLAGGVLVLGGIYWVYNGNRPA
jgi:drug/metabolite transporter (DMT)-like permease